MITNPIFKGFNPDPCICRKGDDYYCAVSSFEWLPGIPVYHSKDLVHWELLTHVLTDQVNLQRLPSAKGIWAPCLTYCEAEDEFYVVYGLMNSMNARYFDVDNYVIHAKEITGPWSEPVYLNSAGFDASMLHDDDGRKYVVSLEWEFRDGYEKPGVICVGEYDPQTKQMVGYPQRIWRGTTNRGCIEAPHLTKKNGYYYLMCAEGGTGYNHCVTMARSKNVFGPYEPDPQGACVTSVLNDSNERHDPDHLKPKYFNPDSVLQKSGHGSYVDLPNGETYLVHLTSRPFVPELRCTLGRETAIQKMQWTQDGWLRMADGGALAQMQVPEPQLPPYDMPSIPSFDDFTGELGNFYYAPRILPQSFASTSERPGFVRLRGQESFCSLNQSSILARKLTSVKAVVTTCLDFTPEVYQHSAGLIMYYDNMNYILLRKYYSQTLGGPALAVLHLENGEKRELLETRVAVDARPVLMRLVVDGRKTHFEWAYGQEAAEPTQAKSLAEKNLPQFTKIGPEFDTSKFSDEYCKYGEFTGTFVGMACSDQIYHRHPADFDFFAYEADETAAVE